MAIKAVIDTNIWISAILNPHGYPARLKYLIRPDDIEELIVLIEERCETVSVTGEIAVCRDRDDNLVIETAIKGGAQYLVTRDDDIKHDESVISFLEKHGIRVTTIDHFLECLTV